MRKLALLLACLAALALPLLLVTAQDDQTVAIGDTVTGTLASGALSARYSLSGVRGDTLTITLTSDDFDAFLTLLDSGGREVASDDDSGGGKNAQIADFSLPATGEYTIVVDSYNRLQTGAYTLAITGRAVPTAAPTESVTGTLDENIVFDSGLTYGQSLDSTLLPEATAMAFRFEGRAGDVVTITVTSNDFDAYLVLWSEGDGAELASDDDSAGNLNARIENFALPADGTYLILVSSFGAGASGAFTVTLESGAAQPIPPSPTFLPTAAPVTLQPTVESEGAISYGQTVEGRLTDDSRELEYTFTGRAGDAVTITLTSDDFDSYLYLQDAGGETLTFDDDTAGNFNARIADFTLPADGTYTIVATSFGSFESGGFTLTLESGALSQPTPAPMTPTPTPEGTTQAVDAPEGGEITFDQPVEGTLTETTAFTFTGRAGEAVTITLTSDDFDAYLRLLGPDGRELASDDDSAGNLNARISSVVLPEDGVYVILAGGFDDSAAGDYGLLLERGDPNAVQPTLTPTQAADGGDLSIGDTVTGRLGRGSASEEYTFRGEIGQVVTISLEADDFDPYLRLLGPGGFELASDDDGGEGLNSQIGLFELPDNGEYTIVVESFDGGSGDYTLSLQPAVLQDIDYNQTISGSLSDDAMTAGYRFRGEEGDTVLITLSSPDFDAYLSLRLSGDSYPLTENDDSGGNTDSLIGPYTLPQTGDYLINVSSYDGAAGSYTLTLNRAELAEIAYGETVTLDILPDAPLAYFSFQGAIGDVVTIRAVSDGSVDTSLTLNGPGGYQVAFDQDGGSGFDPEIFRLPLTQDGTYIVLLQAFAGSSGAVTLTVETSEADSLDDGPQTVRFSSERYEDVLTFTGVAGQQVRLTVEVLTGDSASPYVTVTQDGVTIASASGSYTRQLSLEFTVPDDGRVAVQISDYSYTDLALQVSLEVVE